MDETRKKKPDGSMPQVTDELFRAWGLIHAFQVVRIERTYSDYREYDDLYRFFFSFVHVPPDARKRLENRDMAFVRIARNWLLCKLTSGYLTDHLETIIALRETTDRLNIAMAQHLIGKGLATADGPLSLDIYREAYMAVCSREQRFWQLEAVLKALELCDGVINHLPMNLEDILRFTPKVFIRNTDLLNLCVEAYRTFYRHRHRLKEFDAVVRERETAYINAMFNGAPIP